MIMQYEIKDFQCNNLQIFKVDCPNRELTSSKSISVCNCKDTTEKEFYIGKWKSITNVNVVCKINICKNFPNYKDSLVLH